MGLLLGPGAYYAETTEGAHILSHEGEFALTGRSVYRLLDRLCAGRDIRLAQAIVISGHAWMTNDGWTAGWRRVEARGPEFPSEPAPGPISATAVANQLVHGAFRAITQPAESGRGRMVRINLSTLDSETATVLPHPYAVAAEPGTDLVDRIAGLRYGSRLTDE